MEYYTRHCLDNNPRQMIVQISHGAAAAAAESLQSCPTLCDPIGGSPSGSTVPGILYLSKFQFLISKVRLKYFFQKISDRIK